MTKRFCDLCGKEIHKLQDTYRVSVENNADIPYANDPNIVDVEEYALSARIVSTRLCKT